MITDFVLSAIFGGINALLSLAPGSWTMPNPGNTWTALLMDIGQFNRLFPIVQVAAAASATFGLVVALTLWDVIPWVYHQFWGGD